LLLFVVALIGYAFIGTGNANARKPAPTVVSTQADLVKAIGKNDTTRVEALIAEGADVNSEVHGLLPLMTAKSPEMVLFLAKHGADLNATSSRLKQTVLMFAAGSAEPAVVDALVRAGADVNRKDQKSQLTALSAALMRSRHQSEVVRMLLNAGADPNSGRLAGKPPLHWAVAARKPETAKALLKAGADYNIVDERGYTPLMAAAASRNTEMAVLLLSAGADPNFRIDSTKHERAGASSKAAQDGITALSIAMATGDSVMVQMLRQAGAKEGATPPALDPDKPNPPGVYTLSCSVTGSPPPQGVHFTCTAIGDVALSGTETTISSKAYFGGRYAVPRTNGCQVDLSQPGSYTVHTTETKTPWKLVCVGKLRQTTGEVTWRGSIRTDEPVKSASKRSFEVRDLKTQVAAESHEPPSIEILVPRDGDQFTFEREKGGDPLMIEAEARVSGNCSEAATWDVESIGESQRRFDPEGASNHVVIAFEGLPAANADFGRKRITARACGKSASVIVEVFFDPQLKSHPGVGRGETPNWFFYWSQTSAGRGYSPSYAAQRTSFTGKDTVGQYDYAEDKVFVTDKIMTKSCRARVAALGGKESKGIDCFAETVRHETQHRRERWKWWGSVNPLALNAFERGATDQDWDLVPDLVEDELAKSKGCNKRLKRSCDGRAFDDAIDVEMNTYWVGWEWPVGSADKEDWSWCGKQWSDLSVCPDHKRW